MRYLCANAVFFRAWGVFSFAVLIAVATLAGLRNASAITAAELHSLKPVEAIELLEVLDRWQELTTVDATEVTPFSQTGIRTVAEGLVRVYGLPTARRSGVVADLKKGKLNYLLSEDRLRQYCAEADRVAALVNNPDKTRPIKADFAAEIVHAAPVLSALGPETLGLLNKLDKAPSVNFETALSELRSALLNAMELRRARASVDLIMTGTGAGVNLLRKSLNVTGALSDLNARLPSPELGEMKLCRLADQPWPELSLRDTAVRQKWETLKAAFNGFTGEAKSVLALIERQANAQLSTLPPFSQLIEPERIAEVPLEQLNKIWRTVFAYTPGIGESDVGTVELNVKNDSLKRSVPLGISIANVQRRKIAEARTELKFKLTFLLLL